MSLIRFGLFDVLGRVDQYHIILCSIWRRLLLCVYCISFCIDEGIMILGSVVCEELLISACANDVWVTLHLYATKTQIRIITLLHSERLMSSNTNVLLNRVLIGDVYTVSWLA